MAIGSSAIVIEYPAPPFPALEGTPPAVTLPPSPPAPPDPPPPAPPVRAPAVAELVFVAPNPPATLTVPSTGALGATMLTIPPPPPPAFPPQLVEPAPFPPATLMVPELETDVREARTTIPPPPPAIVPLAPLSPCALIVPALTIAPSQ